MRRLVLGLLFLCLALVVDGQQPQQAERATGSDVTEEEPHPYTISFFLFPRQQTSQLSSGKEKTKNDTRLYKAQTNSTEVDGKAPSSHDYQDNTGPRGADFDLSYQHGSVKHPAHEMYPMCHHCPHNSTYEECTHKRTLKKCDIGLSNICFTKSTKRDKIVHYHMGCANHRECQKARAQPCKAHEKRCFTCCQWSGCNSIAHHGKVAETAFSFWNAARSTDISWAVLGVSLLTFTMTVVL